MLKSGTQLGPYRIVSPLGRGGMGEVYRARDTRLGRELAIKLLPAELSSDAQRLRYFEQEARAASALNHPNIVTIYDIGRSDSASYIAMELVEGVTLREVLASGPLPVRKALPIAAQIAEGLANAHAAGIVHRDLKPENVMLTGEERVKLLDFGLAKLVQPGQDEGAKSESETLSKLSLPGTILGTVGYMSPEQASGGVVDFRSDQFSLGAIFYEMVTGTRAFKRATAVETLSAILREEPEPITALEPRVPGLVRWVIGRCLAKRPEDRYASTSDLARELSGLRDHVLELGAVSASPPPARRSPALAWRRVLGVAAVVTLAAAVTAALLLDRRASATPRFRQLTFRHGNISGARLAGDGRTVVYRATWSGEPANLYTIRPESPESGSLGLSDAGIFSISSAGELAIALGCRLNWGECIGTLARVPLTGGGTREVMKDVHGADWAPEGSALAAVEFTEGVYRLHYPTGKVLYEAPGWITYPRVSPKSDLVAFLDHPTLGDLGGSVCVVDEKGSKRTLSSGWKALQGLAWSAAGAELWFTGSRASKGGNLELVAVTLSGRERVVFSSPGTLKLQDVSRDGRAVLLMRGNPRGGIVSLAPDAPKERDLSWFDYSTVADLSADGRTLLFYEWGEAVGGSVTAYLRRTDGSAAVRLGEGRPLALSPDGRWALTVQPTSPPQIVLLPTGPGEPRGLPRGTIGEYFDWAAWSPDGRTIFFAGQDSGGGKHTFAQDTESGEPRPVTPEGMVGTLLSPDGRSVVAFDRYGEYYLCPLGGGDPRPLEGYADGDVVLQWSADGGSLFVREAGNLHLRLHKLELASGRRQFWKELPPPDPSALTDVGSDPGQVRLTRDGRFYAYTYWTFAGELYLADGLR
jgi:eukaryotic-like serine/threonine-protein kinase